jgi:hypothetical protein
MKERQHIQRLMEASALALERISLHFTTTHCTAQRA